MGRSRHSKNLGLKSRNKNSGSSKLNEQGEHGTAKPHDDRVVVKENENFELYYKTQSIITDPEEWEAFMKAVREPLQSSFRVTGSKSYALQLLDMINNDYIQDLTKASIEVEGETYEPPKCLKWYPNGLAWQLTHPRKAIRHHEKLKRLHGFLVSETESGNISRQEAVSMIPPLLLDVKPSHKVLDMCAAPGSKTAQLLEHLHADESQPVPDGFIIANDVDNKRCYLMVHQIKRLQSPCSVVINHDASLLPTLKTTTEAGVEVPILYDRVLADVPCSGDGTIRKNVDIWHKWTPATALNLHIVQLRILKRGLELLAPGGRLVYSTCSFNPVENEAVIAAMLNQCEGSVSLVDVSTQLPELKRNPGVKSWKVMTKKMERFDTFGEVPKNFHTFIKDTMFPPTNVEDLPLQRCLRIFPHQQDTGGFFVAVLTKTGDLPWMAKAPAETQEETGVKRSNPDENMDNGPPKKKKKQWQGFKEDPFIYIDQDEEDSVWPDIKKFYGVNEAFDPSGLLVRSEGGKKRTLYYTSAALRKIIQANEGTAKFVNTGVKLFARSEHPLAACSYRLVQDGIGCLQSSITDRVIEISKQDCVTLLSEENPFNTKMSVETNALLKETGVGSVLFRYKHKPSDSEDPVSVYLCGWRGKVSSRVYVPKFERHHYLRLCGVDPGSLDRKYVVEQKKEAAENLEEGKLSDSEAPSEEQALTTAETASGNQDMSED